MIWTGIFILMASSMSSDGVLFIKHHHLHVPKILPHGGIVPHVIPSLPHTVLPHHFHHLPNIFHHHIVVRRSVDNDKLDKTQQHNAEPLNKSKENDDVKDNKVKDDDKEVKVDDVVETKKTDVHATKDKDNIQKEEQEDRGTKVKDMLSKVPKVVVQHNGETIFESDNCMMGRKADESAKPPINSNQAQFNNPYYYDPYLQYAQSFGYHQLLYPYLLHESMLTRPQPQSVEVTQETKPSSQHHDYNQHYHHLVFPIQSSPEQHKKPPYYSIQTLDNSIDDKQMMNFAFAPIIYKPLVPAEKYLNKQPSQRLLDDHHIKPVHLIPVIKNKQTPCTNLYYQPPQPKADPYKFLSPDKFINSLSDYLNPYIFS